MHLKLNSSAYLWRFTKIACLFWLFSTSSSKRQCLVESQRPNIRRLMLYHLTSNVTQFVLWDGKIISWIECHANSKYDQLSVSIHGKNNVIRGCAAIYSESIWYNTTNGLFIIAVQCCYFDLPKTSSGANELHKNKKLILKCQYYCPGFVVLRSPRGDVYTMYLIEDRSNGQNIRAHSLQ